VVPDRNQETAITSIQTDPSKEVEINHTLEMRGGFAEMAKKGTIRFTSYNTTEKE
jgi:copper(I)-binding protein